MSVHSGAVFTLAINTSAGCLSLFTVKCLLAAFIADEHTPLGCLPFTLAYNVNMCAHFFPLALLLNQCNAISAISDDNTFQNKKTL